MVEDRFNSSSKDSASLGCGMAAKKIKGGQEPFDPFDPDLVTGIFDTLVHTSIKDLNCLELLKHQAFRDRNLSLSTCEPYYPNAHAILDIAFRYIDVKVCQSYRSNGSSDETSQLAEKDRLFDVLMTRFEVSAPFKNGIRQVHENFFSDPTFAILRRAQGVASMRIMLDLCGINLHQRPACELQIHLISIVYMKIARVWLQDESDDMTLTMAALDQAIERYITKILNPRKITLDNICAVLKDVR